MRRSVARGSSGRTSSSTRASILGDRVQVHRGAILYQGVTADDGVFVGPAAILTNYRRPRALNLAGEPLGPGDWEISPIHLSSGASDRRRGGDRRAVRHRAVGHDRCGRGRHPRRARSCDRRRQSCPAHRLGMRLRRTPRAIPPGTRRRPSARNTRSIRHSSARSASGDTPTSATRRPSARYRGRRPSLAPLPDRDLRPGGSMTVSVHR